MMSDGNSGLSDTESLLGDNACQESITFGGTDLKQIASAACQKVTLVLGSHTQSIRFISV